MVTTLLQLVLHLKQNIRCNCNWYLCYGNPRRFYCTLDIILMQIEKLVLKAMIH